MKNFSAFIAWFVFFNVMLSILVVSRNTPTFKADGQFIVAGDTAKLQFAYAKAQPGFFDKAEEDIVVIVSNISLSEKAIEDRWELRDLASEGLLKFVEITINSKQQPISVSLRHSAFKASPSGFSSNYILELKTFNEKTVEGRMYCKSEQEFFNTVYSFDFTFKAEIRRKVGLPPPTEAEIEAAVNSPQALVYQEFITALNAGNVKAMKNIMSADIGVELDGPDSKEMIEFMQMLTPSNAEFQRITVLGDSAILMLRAEEEGAELKGTVEFVREGRQWKILISNWEQK